MDEEVSLHIKNHAAKGVKRLEERLARFAEQRFCLSSPRSCRDSIRARLGDISVWLFIGF